MVEEIEKVIEYTFTDKSLLIEAFTHSSYANEHKNTADYEKLEFIGDATVEYIVSLSLVRIFPTAKEGVLSKKRASLVNANCLSKIIDNLDLIKYLNVGGTGDLESKIRDSEKVRCDVFEAIVGAILLDSGKNINVVGTFVLKQLSPYLNATVIDYKSKLLEVCAQKGEKAEFIIIEKDEYKPYFKVGLQINEIQVAIGVGRNKKQAEKKASEEYLTKNN